MAMSNTLAYNTVVAINTIKQLEYSTRDEGASNSIGNTLTLD